MTPDQKYMDLGPVKMSLTTMELFKALNKAQAQIESVKKTNQVDMGQGKAKYKYAELSDVQDAIRDPYKENGLSYSQWLLGKGIATMIGHVSGEWIMGILDEPPIQMRASGPQDYGSFSTYLRRYHLAASTGTPQQDDDAIEAQKSSAVPLKPSGNVSPISPRPLNPTQTGVTSEGSAPQIHKPTNQVSGNSPNLNPQTRIVASRFEELKSLVASRDGLWTLELCRLYMDNKWGIKFSEDLTDAQFATFKSIIREMSYQGANALLWDPPEPPLGGFSA